MNHAEKVAAEALAIRRYYGLSTKCHAQIDGDCEWSKCPQIRDNEPHATGRHCPLDTSREDER